MRGNVKKIADHIDLITLLPPIDGFDNFLGAWIYREENLNILVDVGPAVTVDVLCQTLHQLNVDHIDFIFLTHIHVDHAGGIGDFARIYPEARVICHPGGIKHLVQPDRLWQGTVKMLGDTGRAYGKINAVSEKRFADSTVIPAERFSVIDTPGHAAHHLSLLAGDFLFAGEAGGVHLALGEGSGYLRPATPPRFFLETSLNSIDALIEKKPKTICYGHFGAKKGAVNMLMKHRDQLLLWRGLIEAQMKTDDFAKDRFIDQCIDMLLEKDPLLQGFFRMDGKTKKRERGFLSNSVKGFVGYLKNN